MLKNKANKRKKEAVQKVLDTVILNLVQDPNRLDIRFRNKFGMT